MYICDHFCPVFSQILFHGIYNFRNENLAPRGKIIFTELINDHIYIFCGED